MKIIIIASVSSNRVIGRLGQLPWKIPEDLQHFKTTTMNHYLLMGRKTFESIGNVLPGRTSIVLSHSRRDMHQRPDIIFAVSPEQALQTAQDKDESVIYICGGGEIYRQFIEIADEMLITEVRGVFDGDVYFPKFSMKDWKREEIGTIAGNPLIRYTRKI